MVEQEKKIDALDMVINVLREHEASLDQICKRLNGLVSEIRGWKALGVEGEEARDVEVLMRPKKSKLNVKAFSIKVKRNNVEIVKDWESFKVKSKGADLVIFDVTGTRFNLYSVVEPRIYKYVEDVVNEGVEGSYYVEAAPFSGEATSGRLRGGLEFPMRYTSSFTPEEELAIELSIRIDPNKVRSWLSEQLGIDERKVLPGRIRI